MLPPSPSLQAPEVAFERGELGCLQGNIRHLVAWLHPLWIRQPSRQSMWCSWQRARGNRLAGCNMCQVRSQASSGARAPDCVAQRAASVKKDLLPSNWPGHTERRGRPKLGRSPRLEIALFLDDHIESHMGVLQTAELGALTSISAGVGQA